MKKVTNNHVMLFSYDFPNKKTQDFILRLLVEGYSIKYIIAAPWEDLSLPESSIRVKPRHSGLIHPAVLAEHFNIPYIVSKHNSDKTIKYLTNNSVDNYIISGARILNDDIITAANHKIINTHPGMLPEIRGLDTILWSIYNDQPIGVTAHYINSKVDSGLIIYKEKLIIFPDDSLIDISLRQLEKQTDVLISTLKILKSKKGYEDITLTTYPVNTKMSSKLITETLKKFPAWKEKYSKIV